MNKQERDKEIIRIYLGIIFFPFISYWGMKNYLFDSVFDGIRRLE